VVDGDAGAEPKIWCALTASPGSICTGDMNHRGWYAPMGSSDRNGDPNLSRICEKWPPNAVSPAKYTVRFCD
jgi:hypothetical protein